jgi:hypothetical protein
MFHMRYVVENRYVRINLDLHFFFITADTFYCEITAVMWLIQELLPWHGHLYLIILFTQELELSNM